MLLMAGPTNIVQVNYFRPTGDPLGIYHSISSAPTF